MMPYTGKDYVKNGYLITLELESWNKISKEARWAIKKAENIGLSVVESKTTSKINDVLFPKKLKKNQKCYYALDAEKKVVAGIVIELFNSNILYKYSVSKEEGRNAQANSFLIWHVVKKFAKSKYKYFDLGTSYRSELDHFKQQFSCETYPTIYNPPRVKPLIRLDPYYNNQQIFSEANNAEEKIAEFAGKDFTLLPDGRTAIYLILKKLSLNKTDVVTLVTSFNTPYVARDVTDEIELVCKHSRKITKKTKVIYAIHEWGFPVQNIEELREYATKNEIVLIEDCAHSITTSINGKRIGTFGNYTIYSFSKVFPVQYGGMLLGMHVNDNEQKKLRIFDFVKRGIIRKDISTVLEKIPEYELLRIRNYLHLDSGFKKIGLSTFMELKNGVVPHAYLLKSEDPYKLLERLKSFGIEAGVYHKSNAMILPVHQNLTHKDLDYILGVVKSYYF